MKAIVFAGERGTTVLYGDVDELPQPRSSVLIRNARMVLQVASVGFLGLASVGPKPGTDTRITHVVPQTTCMARQAVECTEAATKAIDEWPCWE